MRITKYGHSCLLLEEDDGKLLIDPGAFVFSDDTIKVQDVPQPNAVLITHEHADHYVPDVLKTILAHAPIPVFTNQELAKKAAAEGFHTVAMRDANVEIVGLFTIRAVPGEHGDLPVPKPDNIGFVINDILYHPGDSLIGNIPYGSVPVLALPFMSPWGTVKQALDYAVAMKPNIVIPIHDGFVKSFFLEGMYDLAKRVLEPHGISFHPLTPKESLTV